MESAELGWVCVLDPQTYWRVFKESVEKRKEMKPLQIVTS